MMALTNALEPLRAANRLASTPCYDWLLITPDGDAGRASNGVALTPTVAPAAAGALDMIAVVASVDALRAASRPLLGWLRHQARHGATVGAVSTGTTLLAEAGLLTDRRCTIHWEHLDGFRERYPEIEVTQRHYEVDGPVFSAAGGAAAFDLMLHFVARDRGQDVAAAVAEQFIHPMPVEGAEATQRLPLSRRLRISHPKLAAAIEHMQANLEEPVGRDEIADAVGLSTRQVERLFMRYLGRSPARYYMELRLKRAHDLLCQTALPVVDVSVACGFVSASHFSKCYREAYGHPPRAERLLHAAE